MTRQLPTMMKRPLQHLHQQGIISGVQTKEEIDKAMKDFTDQIPNSSKIEQEGSKASQLKSKLSQMQYQ